MSSVKTGTNTTGTEKPKDSEDVASTYQQSLLGPMKYASNSQKMSSAYQKAHGMAKRLERAMTKDPATGTSALHLGYAGITSESIPVVLRHVKFRDIQEIDLRCNGINPDTLVIISHSIQYDRIAIKKLGLKLNHVGIDDNIRGVEALADAMTTNTKMIEIDLRYNRLSDAHMPAICKIIKVHTVLQSLLLSWNHDITDKGAKMILDSLQNNFTIKNLQIHYCRVNEENLGKLEKRVQINRENEATADADGKVTLKSKTVSAEERAQLMEDPCVKKVRMLNGITHVCKFLEDSQVRCMQAKIRKIETEDKQKALNHSAMEKEAGLLQEILHLEELIVQFSEEKKELEGQVAEKTSEVESNTITIQELDQKRQFYNFKMTDKIRSLDKLADVEKKACSALQEQNYLSQGFLDNEKKENQRLRLYLQTCKNEIDQQFPKPDVT